MYAFAAFIAAPKPESATEEQHIDAKSAPPVVKPARQAQVKQAVAASTAESDTSHNRNKSYSAVAAAPPAKSAAQTQAKSQSTASGVPPKRAEPPKVSRTRLGTRPTTTGSYDDMFTLQVTQPIARPVEIISSTGAQQQNAGVSFSDDDDFVPVMSKGKGSGQAGGASATAARPNAPVAASGAAAPKPQQADIKPALKPTQPAAQTGKAGIGMEDAEADDGWVTVTSKKHAKARDEEM